MTISILSVAISEMRKDELLSLVSQRLNVLPTGKARPLVIATVNPEMIMLAQKNEKFKSVLNQADIQTADGVGVVWAAKKLFNQSIERITGSDFLPEICEMAAKHGASVFFLGAGEGVAHLAAQSIQKWLPNLRIAGMFGGSRDDDFSKLPEHVKKQLSQADVIFVAYGAPAQELWIRRNLSHLMGCKVVMGVGGAFDFVAGTVKRAPKWVRVLGLEWFFRLLLQPWRWRRMLVLPRFVLRVLLSTRYSKK
ncbi:MAG: WecB/TagA/CpsF family glycosyltransferase [bacterium]